MDQVKKDENLVLNVVRQCPTCDRCRDCGYSHIGIACPDPNPDFDGTCLCDTSIDPITTTIGGSTSA